MHFSPAFTSTLIIEPLRFMYGNYVTDDIKWTNDPKTTGIEIDTINNFHKKGISLKPRISVSRGQYSVNPVGLSDNLAQRLPNIRGVTEERRMYTINGVAQILMEATNEGTLEKIVEITQVFLGRAAPLIAETQGFKLFGVPMNVSSPTPDKEDIELFQCTISIPYTKEDHWVIREDSIQLKNFILHIQKT